MIQIVVIQVAVIQKIKKIKMNLIPERLCKTIWQKGKNQRLKNKLMKELELEENKNMRDSPNLIASTKLNKRREKKDRKKFLRSKKSV